MLKQTSQSKKECKIKSPYDLPKKVYAKEYEDRCLNDITENFYRALYSRVKKVDLIEKLKVVYKLCTKMDMDEKYVARLYRKPKEAIIWELITYFKGWL